ncbi:unnamed protein product, partial [Meganyctiphanes norvegica]
MIDKTAALRITYLLIAFSCSIYSAHGYNYGHNNYYGNNDDSKEDSSDGFHTNLKDLGNHVDNIFDNDDDDYEHIKGLGFPQILLYIFIGILTVTGICVLCCCCCPFCIMYKRRKRAGAVHQQPPVPMQPAVQPIQTGGYIGPCQEGPTSYPAQTQPYPQQHPGPVQPCAPQQPYPQQHPGPVQPCAPQQPYPQQQPGPDRSCAPQQAYTPPHQPYP